MSRRYAQHVEETHFIRTRTPELEYKPVATQADHVQALRDEFHENYAAMKAFADAHQKDRISWISTSALDEQESIVESRKAPTPSQLILFHRWKEERALGLKAICSIEAAPGVDGAFIECARAAQVEHSEKLKAHRAIVQSCGSRLCPRCQSIKRSNYATRLEDAIGTMQANHWRFITLTLRSSDAPLAEQLDHLGASFRRLRQQTIWKRAVVRAKGVIEVTWNEERQQWHPHIHILAEGRYIQQPKLSLAWETASQGSTMVNIRALSSTRKAVRYTCKYLGKAPDLANATDPVERLAEYYLATRGRKMILHVGKWPDMPEDEEGEGAEADPGDWKPVGSLDEIAARAKAGDPAAIAIVRELMGQQKAQTAQFDDPEADDLPSG